MNKIKPFIVFSVATISIFSLSSLAFAEEEKKDEPTDEQLSNIQENCPSIKESLRKVQRLDSKTRTTLGATYQSILTRYITPLNVRLVKNNQTDQNLSDLQTEFVNERENFNHDFISYSQKMESLISIDCKNSPKDFYEKLTETREARKKLNDSAKAVNSIIFEQSKSVESLRDSISKEKKDDDK